MSLINGSRGLLKAALEHLGIKLQRLAPNQLRGISPLGDIEFLLNRKASPLIFDVGANDGETSASLLNRFPDARIVAFEPFQDCCEKLTARFAGKSVQVENLALGTAEGEARLNLYSGNRMNSLLELNGASENPMRSYSKTGNVPVKVDTLDTYCDRNNIPFIDILKIDTQGYDLNVLKGGERLLHSQKVHVVFLEINFVPMYNRQAEFIHLHSLLTSFSYRLVAFYNHFWEKNHIAWCDACYVAVPGNVVAGSARR